MAEWFETWFDSPYYPLLYQNRDQSEAEGFIRKLIEFLKPSPDAEFMDLGCGRGRHSVFLHNLGYQVTGLDLSLKSIVDAKQVEEPGLRFLPGDMRNALPGRYDYVLNLFTSFGYFNNDRENFTVIKNIIDALNPGGILVLDYFNSTPICSALPFENKIERGDIRFHISKTIEEGFILKKISIEDGKTNPVFIERVRLFSQDELEEILIKAGLEIYERWGTYEGLPFNRETSPRIILFCKVKPQLH